jgi:hypothetical protein
LTLLYYENKFKKSRTSLKSHKTIKNRLFLQTRYLRLSIISYNWIKEDKMELFLIMDSLTIP